MPLPLATKSASAGQRGATPESAAAPASPTWLARRRRRRSLGSSGRMSASLSMPCAPRRAGARATMMMTSATT
eukprot:1773699-Rhodomonas_salina.1